MAPFAFLDLINPIRWFRRNTAFHKIHPSIRFRDLIERERSRTDRTGIRFSLVVFKHKGRKRETYRSLSHLVGLLISRARTSDEIGWFDRTSLGIILIGAGEAGATEFGRKVTASLPDEVAVPTVSVFVYPKNGQGKERVQQDISTELAILAVHYAYKGLDLRYQPSYRNQVNRIDDLEQKTLTHNGRAMYSDTFFRGRTTLSANYEMSRSETEIIAAGAGAA